MDVHVTETNLFGLYLYRVMVNGHMYDKFTVDGLPLTFSERQDVARYYREALEQ